MHGSAPWKTEETIVGWPRLLVLSVLSRSDSPDLVAVFHPPHPPTHRGTKKNQKPSLTPPPNERRLPRRFCTPRWKRRARSKSPPTGRFLRSRCRGWHCGQSLNCNSDDIGGHPRFPGSREWVVPSAPTTDWLQLVNQPQPEAEAALRCCVNRGRPFGDLNWVTDAAKRLGLESTVQPPGRPKKQS